MNKKRLLLTSGGLWNELIRDEVKKLFTKPAPETVIAKIITASNASQDRDWIHVESSYVEELGCKVEEIDIENKTEEELLSLLKDKDLIYMMGGNTFHLLKQIRLSGFDTVLKQLLQEGVAYIGQCAGSYVACPTIETALWYRPERDRLGVVDLTGMNLVPYIIIAHYFEMCADAIYLGMESATHPVKILRDDQAILCIDDSYTIVGNTEEVVLPARTNHEHIEAGNKKE